MQAASDLDRLNSVTVGSKQVAQLGYAVPICAPRKADEDQALNAQDIASIQSCGLGEKLERPVTRERIRQALSFGPPARRSHIRDDGNLVYDYGRVLNENGIWKPGLGGKSDDPNTQFGEAILIRFVLRDCVGNIDRLSGVKRQLAIIDARAYLTNNGYQGHGKGRSYEQQFRWRGLRATKGIGDCVSKIMRIQHFFLVALVSLGLSGCATQTETTTTTQTDPTKKRVHTQEELKKTGESDTGAALEKVDASVRTSGRP